MTTGSHRTRFSSHKKTLHKYIPQLSLTGVKRTSCLICVVANKRRLLGVQSFILGSGGGGFIQAFRSTRGSLRPPPLQDPADRVPTQSPGPAGGPLPGPAGVPMLGLPSSNPPPRTCWRVPHPAPPSPDPLCRRQVRPPNGAASLGSPRPLCSRGNHAQDAPSHSSRKAERRFCKSAPNERFVSKYNLTFKQSISRWKMIQNLVRVIFQPGSVTTPPPTRPVEYLVR